MYLKGTHLQGSSGKWSGLTRMIQTNCYVRWFASLDQARETRYTLHYWWFMCYPIKNLWFYRTFHNAPILQKDYYHSAPILHSAALSSHGALVISHNVPILYRNIFPMAWFKKFTYGCMHLCPEKCAVKEWQAKVFVFINNK